MLRDLAPNELHRFLWSNHFAYAAHYEIARRFDPSCIESSRRTLLAEIAERLHLRGIEPATTLRSVFDAGCSLGYLLRYAETELFPTATILRGFDIDHYAVETGAKYLRSLNSKIDLMVGDLTDANRLMGEQTYDVVICCGVLMYVDESTAVDVMRSLLRHTRWLLGIISLGHPDIDNALLQRSCTRPVDGALIHNLVHMVRESGGTVVFSRWEPSKTESSSAYTVIAEPSLFAGAR